MRGTVTLQGKVYRAAVYADQRRRILEAHLIDFVGGAIKGSVTVMLGPKVREDRMFDTDEALKMAIVDDIEQVRALSME